MSSAAESADDSQVASLVAEIADDFAARVASGERPCVSDYVVRYPNHATTIRQILGSLECIQQAELRRSHPIDTRSEPADVTRPREQLGDFTLEHEIGRGGMGVVYKARQTTLGRTVAVKVLPLAASLDPMKLKRFRIETQAAATLQHPHIVTIYGTGFDAGVHYYVMQFIEGQTLDQRIRLNQKETSADSTADSRWSSILATTGIAAQDTARSNCDATNSPGTPTCPQRLDWRHVVMLGRQLAEALGHAHEHGVVHRDIKPSNILLDHRGHPWLTDFGLASIESNEALTRTGDLVGTLRYMSPEQASGCRTPIDHRTDIYSLGATLYEVLTRRAVCDGEDRETILRQLMTEEPVALRRHDPRIPLDLETIILKSVSRQRDDRYATAQELADDLQRLLDDRPILARRPTLSQRVAKWTRRHRSATAAGVGALMLLSVGLLISNIAIARQKAATERALQIATANEARAVTEQRKAAAIRDVMQQLVGAAHPDQRKGNTYTVRQLLDNLSSELIAPLDDQPEVQAALRSTVGNAYRRLGAPDKAAPLLSAVLTMRQAARPLDQVALAESLKDVAWNEAAQSRYAQAEDYARQAVALYEQHGPPAPPRINALWCLQHSLIYQQKYLQADQTAQQAMELGGPIPEAQADLSNVLHNLAQSKNLQGKPVEAEALAREAVTLHRAIHGDRHPETAWGLDALGRALASQKKWSEAAASFREAMGIFSEHYDAGHKSVRQADENLRMVLRAQGDHDGIAELDRRRTELTAQAFLRQRIHDRTLLDLLVEHDQVLAAAQLLELGEPQLLDQTELIQAATMMARCAQDVLKPHDSAQCELAGQRFRLAARRLIEKAVQACPQDAHAENQLAWWLVSHDDPSLHDPAQAIQLARQALDKQPDADHVWNTLGVALYRDGQWAEAIEALERSCQGKGGGPYDLVFLAMAHWQLGHTDQARTLFARAQHLASTEPHSHELQGFLDEARALLDNPR